MFCSFSYVLSAVLLCSSLLSEERSYLDLLKKCDAEQEVALKEANAFMGLDTTSQFRSLEGGLTRNALYSFEIEGKKYVLRFMALGPNQPEEKRQNEVSALRIAHGLGLAPNCVFSDQHAVLMIMPFVEGGSFHHPDDSQVVQLGHMLHNLHTFSGSYPTRLSSQQRLESEFKKGLKLGIAYPTGFDQEVTAVLRHLSPCQSVPIHGDLHPANILVSPAGISVIDWANATWDDPFVDLAYCCLISDFSQSQERAFLEAYFGRAPLEEDYAVLQEAKAKVCLYTAAIWFRFSEDPEEQLLSYASRVEALDAELNAPTLKAAQDYLREGVVVNFRTAPKSEVKSYALSFYKAYLDAKWGCSSCSG